MPSLIKKCRPNSFSDLPKNGPSKAPNPRNKLIIPFAFLKLSAPATSTMYLVGKQLMPAIGTAKKIPKAI
ncbi:hypothetical protein BpHYR1_007844 [Brachionus plicatilis]|uniref:Uncharacterized protein n=1 Tax=Brachionus plicatilis TaxID=10195 RepID=A0A3M7S5P8_BRAPC|nr:hypothetical protein BpHYR1_007844 [Brachionus plicatilis]